MSANTLSKHYFLPMLIHRHTEVALCSHEHCNIEEAKTCLQEKKLEFNQLLEKLDLPPKAKRNYLDAKLLVREIELKLSWALGSQQDHSLDGEIKPLWQNSYLDLMHLPLVGVVKSDQVKNLVDLINKIDWYHDQPKRKSKNRPTFDKPVTLNDFVLYGFPNYLTEAKNTLT